MTRQFEGPGVTPEPWEWTDVDGQEVLMGANDHAVVRVDRDSPVRLPDSRLIVKAPKLLHALRMLHRVALQSGIAFDEATIEAGNVIEEAGERP